MSLNAVTSTVAFADIDVTLADTSAVALADVERHPRVAHTYEYTRSEANPANTHTAAENSNRYKRNHAVLSGRAELP